MLLITNEAKWPLPEYETNTQCGRGGICLGLPSGRLRQRPDGRRVTQPKRHAV